LQRGIGICVCRVIGVGASVGDPKLSVSVSGILDREAQQRYQRPTHHIIIAAINCGFFGCYQRLRISIMSNWGGKNCSTILFYSVDDHRNHGE